MRLLDSVFLSHVITTLHVHLLEIFNIVALKEIFALDILLPHPFTSGSPEMSSDSARGVWRREWDHRGHGPGERNVWKLAHGLFEFIGCSDHIFMWVRPLNWLGKRGFISAQIIFVHLCNSKYRACIHMPYVQTGDHAICVYMSMNIKKS